MDQPELNESTDFIRTIINEDMDSKKYDGRVHTRFPPEPNGYLHIGHAKSICLNFGVAAEYGGLSNLRFDDTNPSKEEQEYVNSIQEDVRWLGFDWEDRLYYASDYFDQLYDYALQLIKKGEAYVDDLSADEIRAYRGTLTEPGKESPFRNRSVEENLDLFERMRAGDFPDGSRTLRAKIDMSSPNITMRDPVLYRILNVPHHRTGDKWCIYPMYDFTHCLSDSIEVPGLCGGRIRAVHGAGAVVAADARRATIAAAAPDGAAARVELEWDVGGAECEPLAYDGLPPFFVEGEQSAAAVIEEILRHQEKQGP